MTSPRSINEAEVHGGRLVRLGDKVKLLPVEQREMDKEAGDYFAQKDYDQQHGRYGDGPFKIIEITQWPCGQTYLHIKGGEAAGGAEGAERAEDFM